MGFGVQKMKSKWLRISPGVRILVLALVCAPGLWAQRSKLKPTMEHVSTNAGGSTRNACAGPASLQLNIDMFHGGFNLLRCAHSPGHKLERALKSRTPGNPEPLGFHFLDPKAHHPIPINGRLGSDRMKNRPAKDYFTPTGETKEKSPSAHALGPV